MAHRPSSSNPEADVALELDDTQALRALTAEGTLPALLILSTDAHVIHVARKAVPTGMAITDAANVDEVADRLPSIDPGVLIVDSSGSRDVESILPQLTQHFPEMVVIVVGNKEDSSTLLRLTAEGRVFRFLLNPLSHGQARLAIKAAVAHHIDLKSSGARRATEPPPVKRRNYMAAYGGLAAAALVAIVGVWYAVGRLTVEPVTAPVGDPIAVEVEPRVVPERVDPVLAELNLAEEAFAAGNYLEPHGESALDFYRNALALDPTNERAQRGVREVADKVLERAEAALTAERLEDATRNIETVRDIDPAHPRLVFLDVQVARERERMRLARERSAEERMRRLRAQSDQGARSRPAVEPEPVDARGTAAKAREVDPAPASETSVPAREVPDASVASTGPTAPVPPVSAGSPASADDEPIDAVRWPRTRETPAKYPREALLARIEGYVDLEFTISPEGFPEDLVVRASSPRRTFDRAAIDAVRRWRFQPVMRDGVAVAQRARLRMTFKL